MNTLWSINSQKISKICFKTFQILRLKYTKFDFGSNGLPIGTYCEFMVTRAMT